MTGINVVTSGVPLDLTYTPNTSDVVSTTSSVYSLRSNLVSTPKAIYGSTLVKTNTSITGFLNPAALSDPSGSQLFGNAGRTSLRGPAFGRFDLAARKTFDLPGERAKPHFRLEAFNVLNATNYIAPTTNFATVANPSLAPSDPKYVSLSGNFGAFSGSSSVYPSRQVQVALRLAF